MGATSGAFLVSRGSARRNKASQSTHLARRDQRQTAPVAQEAGEAHRRPELEIRAIAADAGVDPSLVMPFYGNKEALFGAVLQQLSGFTEGLLATMAGPRAGLGARVARTYLQVWEEPVTGDAMRSLIRATLGSPRASSVLRNYVTGKLSGAGVAEQKRLGVQLATSHLLGTGHHSPA